MRAELLEQRATQRRLARADFAGDLHETFPLTNSIEQMVERFAMLRTVKQEPRVGRDVEWRFAQAIVIQVHTVF